MAVIDPILQAITKPQREVYNMPLPMAVFGSLRDGCSNNRYMRKYEPESVQRAYLPDFKAVGFYLEHSPGESQHPGPSSTHKPYRMGRKLSTEIGECFGKCSQ